MRIATTYDNGNIFQHFGRTEEFKVYEIADGEIVSSEVIGNEGLGHGALASLLATNSIDVLICGGIGGGAISALSEAGVQVCSGAEGDSDAAVAAFLRGELVDAGSTCHHHDHEEGHSCGDHGCGGHEEGGCSGGCGGGCGAPAIIIDGPNAGKLVKVHYRGTLNDGTQFDSSYDRGQTLDFVCGIGMMIRGFDEAVAQMTVGQEVDIHLSPDEAYGQVDPDAIFTLNIADLPGSEDLVVGEQILLNNSFGQQFPATVTAKDETTVTFDANPEFAGQELNFHIELIEVVE